MDAMELSSRFYPAGLTPEGHPSLSGGQVPMFPGADSIAGGELMGPTNGGRTSALAVEEDDGSGLPSDDMELLERILRECHLHEEATASRQQNVEQQQLEQQRQQQQQDLHQQPSALPLSQSLESQGQPSQPTVESWAGELVRRLQNCASTDEANLMATELLTTFQQRKQEEWASAVQLDRLQKVQDANRVLLRGFRNLHRRSRAVDAQRCTAEEANTRLAAELVRSHEALHASERARSLLQYHLQLMDPRPGTAAGGM
eukprot:TRINITY_DN18761_c0_g1_i1.p1 TRINITY_DN18761_c0_g1~~TRINITY_DN18761_c0_g1_i1.p1  ORF type:complete len:296 (-),score=56.50 TRINITY_DN18761_c0_g1_i1:128-904(-)